MTDRAWPNFIAPPLSSPSTEKSCSAVRACSSAATASAGAPPDPLPDTEGGAPGMPQGQADELGGPGQRAAGGCRSPGHCPRRAKQSGRSASDTSVPTPVPVGHRQPVDPDLGRDPAQPRGAAQRRQTRSPWRTAAAEHGRAGRAPHRALAPQHPGRGPARSGRSASRRCARGARVARRPRPVARARGRWGTPRRAARAPPPTTACAPRPTTTTAAGRPRAAERRSARRRRPRADPHGPGARGQPQLGEQLVGERPPRPSTASCPPAHRPTRQRTTPRRRLGRDPPVCPRPAAAVHRPRTPHGPGPRGPGPFDSRLGLGLRPCRGCG